MRHLALAHDLTEEPIISLQPATYKFRSSDDQVQGERPRRQRHPDPYGLVDHVSGGHDHQEVDVAVRVGRAVGVRAEEDDLLRVKSLGNVAR